MYGGKAALECIEDLKEASQNLCPVNTGHLRDSVLIEETKKSSMQGYKISYNTTRGNSSDYNYAVVIHESPELNFNTDKNPNAQAKFLEQPLKENLPKYVEKIKDAISKGFAKE